ncbi:MAG: hypothetical protein H7326_00035 [Bdellovibrionaceae bacterium]|nr:hypothetical protein [Pseudobdellovibrionaceae bacterium]
MRHILTVIVLSLISMACSKKDAGTAAPVDQEQLDVASESFCPTNFNFAVSNENISLGKDSLPSPALFAIQKGTESCASLSNIDHGGLTSWLNVT